jgi:1-phosphatidylinositol-3-phosphate 5-kinase
LLKLTDADSADALSLQNLFYERQLTQVFDLKGSTRNRHVTVTKERPNEVLMDENLVESEFYSVSSTGWS